MKRLSHALYTAILTRVEIQPNKKAIPKEWLFLYDYMTTIEAGTPSHSLLPFGLG